MSWQPIDTAPRDGTPVLLWAGLDGGNALSPIHGAVWDTIGKRWAIAARDGRALYGVDGNITHWMPQPEPPQ